MVSPRDATTLFQRHSADAPPGAARDRFTPGAIVADRYRIVALLGRGGMGEVYRAEDLRLDQQVALKFLPPALQSNAEARERFLGELRLGRQVSHPNVCRLYDLGNHEGHDFLTMEYVDGEDLSSLLQRIGKLPAGKSVQIARDIAAGLAAAHALGIVHRDLKPSNVMIDGRGRARVTDFGLAVLESDFERDGRIVGTAAYMAPEQLLGAEVTPRSDVYALGVILYESLTGEPLHRGDSSDAIIRQRIRDTSSGSIAALPDLDPGVDRLLRRCLDPDPLQRPQSAIEVLRLLPGGDPLAAAMAAGETPSPELVATAAGRGELSVRAAWTLVIAMIVLAVATAVLSRSTFSHHLVDGIRAPDALRERAQDVAAGFAPPARDRDGWFAWDIPQRSWLSRNNPDARHWRPIFNARPAPLRYVYRQSPLPMAASRGELRLHAVDPPLDVPGMARIVFDQRGRLLELAVVPDAVAQTTAGEPQWDELFALAEVRRDRFQPATPMSSPPVATDVRRAWTGVMPDSKLPIRIEAGAWAGRPVWFAIVTPWAVSTADGGDLFVLISRWLVSVAIPLFTAVLAFGNLRRGRGDRRGAMTFALVAFLCALIGRLFRAHHVPTVDEIVLIERIAGKALLSGIIVALAYLGLEPYVRRFAPEALISWVRLANGRLRDTLVGRDTLIGLTCGSALSVVWLLGQIAQPWLGFRAAPPSTMQGSLLSGLRDTTYVLLEVINNSLMDGITVAVLMVVFSALFRNRWLATALLWVAISVVLLRLPGDAVSMRLAVAGLMAAVVLLVLRYAGVLGIAAMSFAATLYLNVPVTLDSDDFYFGRAMVTLLIPVALAVFAFLASRADKAVVSELP